MPVQLIRKARNKQPQEFLRVDWSNSIASKVCAIAVPYSVGTVNLYKSAIGEAVGRSSGGGVTVKGGVLGYGVGRDGAESTDSLRLHSVGNQTNTAWEKPTTAGTWFVVAVRYGNTSGNSKLFSNADAGTDPYDAWAITDVSGNGTFTATCSAGGTYRSTGASATVINNKPVTFCGRYTGSSLDFFIDGKLGAASTSCSGNITYPNVVTRGPAIGNFYDYTISTRAFNGRIYLALLFPVALSDGEISSLSANPWQIFEPETIPLFYSTVTAQYARPTSDVSTGTWTSSLGGSLYAAIDETVASDTDYITTTNASTCEVGLSSLSDPASSAGHIVRYRISATSGGITVRLRQGTTTIATWTHATAPTSLTTYSQTLTGGEADSITDYTTLRLQFEAT